MVPEGTRAVEEPAAKRIVKIFPPAYLLCGFVAEAQAIACLTRHSVRVRSASRVSTRLRQGYREAAASARAGARQAGRSRD
jgi:hypothetical protein